VILQAPESLRKPLRKGLRKPLRKGLRERENAGAPERGIFESEGTMISPSAMTTYRSTISPIPASDRAATPAGGR
jgi:hypothetical protein